MRVRVDPERCVGHGRCYTLGPDVYGPDEAGHCEILIEDVPPELARQARVGADNCPEHAITVDPG